MTVQNYTSPLWLSPKSINDSVLAKVALTTLIAICFLYLVKMSSKYIK